MAVLVGNEPRLWGKSFIVSSHNTDQYVLLLHILIIQYYFVYYEKRKSLQ